MHIGAKTGVHLLKSDTAEIIALADRVLSFTIADPLIKMAWCVVGLLLGIDVI